MQNGAATLEDSFAVSYKTKYALNMKNESEVAQLCLTLCDPMDCSLPDSSVHGILQARILQWVAIPFFQAITGFPRSSVSKEFARTSEDPDLIPGSGRSPGEGNGNPLQYSCLENPMDRASCQATYSPWGCGDRRD